MQAVIGGHTTTQVEAHPVVLEDLKPLEERAPPATATHPAEEEPTKTQSDANPYGIDKAAEGLEIPESEVSHPCPFVLYIDYNLTFAL